jgi:pseudomonalisin
MNRRTVAIAGLTALIAGGAGTGLATASAASAPAWAATATQAVRLHLPSIGNAPASHRLTVSVALAMPHRAEVTRRIAAMANPRSPLYRHYLTPSEVRARYSPSPAAAATVESYLRRSGFRNLSIARNRLLVTGSATVAQVQQAFHTTIRDYRLGGSVVYANSRPAMVPHALAGTVSAVLGLSDVPMTGTATGAKAATGTAAAGSSDLSGFDPKAIAHAYDADKLPPAKSTSVGLVVGGDLTNVIKNLRYAERKFGFPKVPVTVVYGAGKAEDTEDNPLTDSVEWDLDTQYSTMVAGTVKRLYLYDVATFTDPEVARAINLFVERDQALNLSASLGECESLAFLDGSMIATDDMLAQGALQGQSMFASSGDNGMSCPVVISTGVPGSGPPGVSWPAVGEYTTGVGGTTLLADDKGNVQQELAWSGSGGGVALWETAPPWTLRDNIAGQTWQENNYGGRGVPDIAAVADSNTPVLVYAGGSSPEGVGGTSVASPVVMGLWTRIQNADRDRLGLAAPDFYRLYNKVNPGTKYVSPVGLVAYAPAANPQPVPGFRDVEVGANGAYPALPGYDYVTGVGTPDSAKLAKLLQH